MDGCFDKDGNIKPTAKCQEVELSKYDPVFDTKEECKSWVKKQTLIKVEV